MRQSQLLGLLPWLATASPIAEQHDRTQVDSISNANHIFNSIHDSMRQFGSSLNHNGMGVFIATVPEGTEFYHGTSSQYRINGTEWLAFEPEHAMIFARSRNPGGPGGPGRRPGGVLPGERPHEDYEDEGEDDNLRGPPHHGLDRHGNKESHSGPPCKGHQGGNGTHHGPPGHEGPGKKPHGPPGHEDPEKKPHSPPGREGPGRKPHDPPGHHDEDKSHGPPRGPPPGEHPGHHDGDKPRGPPRGPPPDKHSDHDDQRKPHHSEDRPVKGNHPKGDKEKHHANDEDDQSREERHHSKDGQRSQSKEGKKEKHDCKKDKNDPKQDKKENHTSKQQDHYSEKELPSEKEDDAPLEDIYDAKNNAPWPRAFKDRKQEAGPRGIIGAIGRLIGHHQEPLSDDTPSEEPTPSPQEVKQKYGYLHTYRTKHPLRLIYVDGQSAAKSDKGTLDVQDLILRNHTSADADEGRGMMGEKQRADDLCQLIHTEYADRVDGILRMEGGFEIILCDFAKDLDVVSILPAKASGMGPGGSDADHFNYWQAISARYFDIGANRVRLDFESFTTLFAYPSAIYFDETSRPRVKNNTAELDTVRQDIKKMILGPDSTANADVVNWQDITDLIVTRYADRIAYMTSGDLTTLSALSAEIERALRPFIDYSARNASLEAERCATQFMPSASALAPSVAGTAIKQTYQTMCSALASAGHETDYDDALETVRQLKQYLAWTTWKKCSSCASHEICLVPVWPMGSKEDFEQPPCVSSATIGERHGDYWHGGPGGPGGRRDRGDGKEGQDEKKKSDEKHREKGNKQDKKGKKYAQEKNAEEKRQKKGNKQDKKGKKHD